MITSWGASSSRTAVVRLDIPPQRALPNPIH
jgi:hypothetical protein